MKLALVLFLAAALAAACESGGAPAAGHDDATGDPAADVPGDRTDGGPPPATLEQARLEGTWAREVTQTAFTTLPVVGETTTRTTTLNLLAVRATVEGDVASLVATTTVCDLDIDNGTDLVQTVVPDALLASLAVLDVPATVSATAEGLAFEQPRFVELRGVRLTNPDTDPLPTDAALPAVFDQDGDGHPGVTMRIAGLVDGEVYVIQRRTSALSGAFVDTERIAGRVEWTDEQVVLGADNPLLESERTSRPAPPDDSTFVMQRVPDGTTCETLRAERAAWF